MTYIEGNKLIADFMDVGTTEKDNILYTYKVGEFCIKVQYHTSWDWLMPVVDKIVRTAWNMEGAYKQIEIVEEKLCIVEIDFLWKAVVQFIQWYNSNKTIQP